MIKRTGIKATALLNPKVIPINKNIISINTNETLYIIFSPLKIKY